MPRSSRVHGVAFVKIGRIAGAIAVPLLCAGCASAIEGSTQSIYVATLPEVGASCVASNDRGSWPVVTPGAVVIKKSVSVLQIICSKPGYQDGKVYASGKISSTAMVGMLLFGVLEAAADGSSGAAQTYPDSYTIPLKTITADSNAGTAGAPAPDNKNTPASQ